MDIDTSPDLDELLDQIEAQRGGDGQSETPASDEEISASVEDVAVQADDAVADAPLPEDAPPTPQADYAAELEAMKAQLAQVGEKAERFDRLEQMAREAQAQREEQERFDAWQSRMDALEDLPKEYREVEKQRLISEVRQYRDTQYQADVAQQGSMAEEAAKAFAALYTAVESTLPPDMAKTVIESAKFVKDKDSADSMKAQFARDKALELRGYERAKAELAKAAESKLAKQAQERIASGADLVGVGAGIPAKGNTGSIDEILDSINW